MPENLSAQSILDAAVKPPCPLPRDRQSKDWRDSDVIKCCIRASNDVFRLNCNLDLGEPSISSECAVDRLEMSGVVCISGARDITVAVNATSGFCRRAYESLTANCDASVEDLHDTLGELANQLVGSAKDMLPFDDLELGLPTIVWGAGHNIAFASDMTHYVIRFSGDDGLRVEVGISEGKYSS